MSADPDASLRRGSRGAGGAPAGALRWRQLLGSTARLFRLSLRVTFRRKLLFMLFGIVAYYGLLYAIVVFEPNAGLSVDEALLMLVDLPGTVIAVYLTMDLVASERDRKTLETLFSTASSHYSIWMVRLGSVLAVLMATLLTMSTAAYFLFAEFPFVRGAFNAFVPAAVFVGVTFYAAVRARGANTAAMMASAVLVFVLMLTEEMAGSRYWLFLDPFRQPTGGNPLFWIERILLNRLAYLALAGLLIFLGLRRMERRESFLS